MTTSDPVSPRLYFNQHAHDVREFIPVTMVHGLKKGDPYYQGPASRAEVRIAETDGYVALTEFFESPEDGFLTAQQLVERTYDLSGARMIAPREPLPADFIVHPVSIGETMQLGTPDALCEKYAPYDGFVVREGNEKCYMHTLELMSTFNYVSPPPQSRELLIAAFHSSTPIAGILLREDVTFMMEGPFHVEKGGALLLFRQNGELFYGALPPRSARALLRREPEVLSPPRPGQKLFGGL